MSPEIKQQKGENFPVKCAITKAKMDCGSIISGGRSLSTKSCIRHFFCRKRAKHSSRMRTTHLSVSRLVWGCGIGVCLMERCGIEGGCGIECVVQRGEWYRWGMWYLGVWYGGGVVLRVCGIEGCGIEEVWHRRGVPRCMLGYISPNGETNMSINITFPQLRLWAVTITYLLFWLNM